ELGIVLRCERLSGQDSLMVVKLTELRVNPPESADPAAFTPREAAGPGLMSRIPAQIVRQAAKTSTSVTATALAAGLRCLSAPLRLIAGPGGTMPAAPRPQPAAPGQVMSIPGHVLDLLYQGWPGAPCVRAELHQWADPKAIADSALSGWDAAGIRGAGRLIAAMASFDKSTYRADQGLAARGGQYNIETIRARRPRGPAP